MCCTAGAALTAPLVSARDEQHQQKDKPALAVAVLSRNSGSGAAASKFAALKTGFDKHCQERWTLTAEPTQRAGHAIDLARRACEEGRADAIIAIGGDGTVAEVVNGVASASRPLPIAVCSSGTWNILADALRLPSPSTVPKLLAAGQTRRIPLFCVEWRDHSGVKRSRFAFMGIDFGLGAHVVASTEEWKKSVPMLPSVFWQYLIGPAFLATAWRHTVSSGKGKIRLEECLPKHPTESLEPDNCVMLWAHARSPFDGSFDRLHVSYSTKEDTPWFPRLAVFFALRQLYNGMAQICPNNRPVDTFTVSSEAEFDFLIDGELCRADFVSVKVCDKAVDIFAPNVDR